VPSAGPVTAGVGASLFDVAAVVLLFALGVALMGLALRWLTGQLHADRQARRRRQEQQGPEAAREQVPPRPTAPRPAAAGHHPVGRRVPGAQGVPPTAVQPATGRPPVRRPLQLVAADVRRLTRELSMVPGGMPMARRRGLLAAYDDVLVEAAALLEVPHQLTATPPGNRELERMRLLASLEAAGLVVTD
jgi:hypothetical protein